jgi:putative endonuclease
MSQSSTDQRQNRRNRQWLGRAGEAQAARFLEARGYRIVARNVRADRVEIDVIVRRGELLVFVEVKSRRASQHGHAAEAVDERKQRRLRRGAHAWLAANPTEARQTRSRRFDVVTCLLDAHPDSDLRAPDPRARSATETAETQNKTTAPETARWSIEHWESAF